MSVLLALLSAVLITIAAAPCIIAWENAGCPTLEEL